MLITRAGFRDKKVTGYSQTIAPAAWAARGRCRRLRINLILECVLPVGCHNRRGLSAERNPPDRVLALALDEDVACPVPGQDCGYLVVEDEVAAVGPNHQDGVALG